METLREFATYNRLVSLLVKERVKCCRKNGRKGYSLHVDDTNTDESIRLQMSLLMPQRAFWMRPMVRRAFYKVNGKLDTKKLNAKAIRMTIERDRKIRKRQGGNDKIAYLDRLDEFVKKIQDILASDKIEFQCPVLKPLLKSKENVNGHMKYTFRPLSVYTKLEDKIILAVTSRYFAGKFNRHLHDNILSYRSARNFHGEKAHVTDFNDGVKMICSYRKYHSGKSLFATDCDIKKFYDTINHDIVRECFIRIMEKAKVSKEGIRQVMNVMDAYLASYNFYDNVIRKSEDESFWKPVRKKMKDHNEDSDFSFGWVKLEELANVYGNNMDFADIRSKIGVSQGGALSLMIADVVLNDVDQCLVNPEPYPEKDKDKLFIRFCDDMILMHTNKEECDKLMGMYCKSLQDHKLIYHDFTDIHKNGNQIDASFWNAKSHNTFEWASGSGDSSEWVGFLGYEINHESMVRLRKSNLEKLKDKLRTKYFGISRKMMNNVSISELKDYIHSSQKEAVESLKFYTGLTLNDELEKQLMQLNTKRMQYLNALLKIWENKRPYINDDNDYDIIRRALENEKSNSYIL